MRRVPGGPGQTPHAGWRRLRASAPTSYSNNSGPGAERPGPPSRRRTPSGSGCRWQPLGLARRPCRARSGRGAGSAGRRSRSSPRPSRRSGPIRPNETCLGSCISRCERRTVRSQESGVCGATLTAGYNKESERMQLCTKVPRTRNTKGWIGWGKRMRAFCALTSGSGVETARVSFSSQYAVIRN